MFTRRHFLHASAATVATAVLPALAASPARWPIGCFNRPWVKWGCDAALDGVKAAGYRVTGLLTRTKTEPLAGADATPEYLDALKKKIAARGLTANMAALRVNTAAPFEEAQREVRQQVENAKRLGLEFLLTFGVDKPAQYENFYKLMADGAAFAQERGLKLVIKPHGGGSGAAEEILRCLGAVKHPNFKVWYDAGNIIYYTGKDPVAELERVAEHVTGFCAKDCAKEKGDVMIQFGTGRVDFTAVFRTLKKAGFNGPVMVECCAVGNTAEETTANAKANREFLEKVFAAL
ncbi:MAG: sugar phosphate isomerase/epimerase [Verrucomicrobia bacterium]|nr:sugar phosphate isomerase/epimerase [Verrucomicrobiota bacterium]